MAKKVKATHRLTGPHIVIFDPAKHFVEGFEKGKRCTLPTGTHMIPRETELISMPDRFQSLASPEPPAEQTIEEDAGAGEQENGDAEDEADDADTLGAAHAAVYDALSIADGDWDALTVRELSELAEGYELVVTAASGNVVKADYIRAVQEVYDGVAE